MALTARSSRGGKIDRRGSRWDAIEDMEVGLTLRQQLRVLACHDGIIHDFGIIIIASRVNTKSSFQGCHRYRSPNYCYFRMYEKKKDIGLGRSPYDYWYYIC